MSTTRRTTNGEHVPLGQLALEQANLARRPTLGEQHLALQDAVDDGRVGLDGETLLDLSEGRLERRQLRPGRGAMLGEQTIVRHALPVHEQTAAGARLDERAVGRVLGEQLVERGRRRLRRLRTSVHERGAEQHAPW